MEVGEYIRIRGELAQITNVGKIDNHYIYSAKFNDKKEYKNIIIDKKAISKHSKNLIDLIEVRRLCKR